MIYLQRKYIDLIRHVSSKWVNWDPPIPVQVGTYGEVEYDTGGLRVEGNIYDPEFQVELDKLKWPIRMSEYPPEEGGVEDDIVFASRGARRVAVDLGPQIGITGLANVSIQGQWEFDHGKRDALLIMHCPRMRFIPNGVVLERLYQVPRLKDKWLVTNVHICPAYSMYLSNKSGEKVSLALVGQVPVPAAPAISAGGEVGLSWWTDCQAELHRRAADKSGKYCFTPLYTMKRRTPWIQRVFRERGGEDTGNDLWDDAVPPWDPLNEDGEEDSLDVEDTEDASEF